MKGYKCVVITYDPDNPGVSLYHPRVLRVSGKLGKVYMPLVNAYISVKSEYDSLLNEWYSTYNYAPPRVEFPIRQFSDPHYMNNEFYESQNDCRGKYKSENPTVSNHGEFKSKNEQMSADLLKQMGIPFQYETEVHIASIEQTINPDYLINFYEIDRCSYLEILGMNDKFNYSVDTATKINGFCRDLYRPGREVIYILLYDKYNFDEEYFVSQVLSAFNDMIPDDALIWGDVKKAG